MAITKFLPTGIKTQEVHWNHGILRLTQDAELHVSEDRGTLYFFVYEPELDQEFLLAEIEFDVKKSDMNEDQYSLFFWILNEYDEGVDIKSARQLEDTFKKLVGELRKIGLIK